MARTRIDDCLSTRNGHLFVEGCDTLDLVRQFGSPLFVMSENQIRRNVRRFQRAFQEGWPDGPVKVLPAAKANWLPAVQRILADEGCGCDVYSPGELRVALDAGFDPQFISVNGVPKDKAHIYKSIQAGVRITIDSVEEIEVIEKAANELDRVARVRLRLKPALSGFIERSDFVAEGLVPTDIAAMVYKGGLSFDEIMAIGPRILAMDNVELVGLHEHHGRHHRSLRYWEEQMKAFAREAGRVCEALGGFQPQEIDIGGGFAVPRDPFNAVTDYSEPLQLAALYAVSKGMNVLGADRRYKVLSRLIDTIVTRPNQTPAPGIKGYADVCTHTLRQELPRYGIDTQGLMLQLEPGRAIHGNAGIHLTTVRNIKRLSTPIRWKLVIVDTTEFWFTGGRYEHHLHDYVFANKTDAEMVDKADIIGRSCYGDRLMPAVPIPADVEVGDILALLDTGAYQQVSMSNFNAIPRPATVLVTGERASIVRRRETEADVFRRDVMPEHLQRKETKVAERVLA
jgi:diaminopimelate decarboxylase